MKPQRFNNVHLGTDRKTTLKDIPLTPGPGHYIRVDEQYPRTFHHATKHGTNMSPIFSTQNDRMSFRGKATDVMQSEGDGDVQSDAKINSMRKHTASHFFGVPTGAESFYETMMSGFSKKVQPPMLVGKAKVPSDLACVLSGQNSRAGHHHKTIEHNRTSTSFVNNTSCHDYGGQLSPLEIDTGREDKMPTGRHSLIQKHAGKVSINKEKMFTPKQRSMVVSNAQSEENFM